MIFLTVGSSKPFDRLVMAVDALANRIAPEAVFAQIGDTRHSPDSLEWVHELSKGDFDAKIAAARVVISHAGIGTIASALEMRKPVIVMPRRRAFGEAVNDHQVTTAERFSEKGHILLAREPAEICDCLARVEHFVPTPRTASANAVSHRVALFLASVCCPELPASAGLSD